MIKVENECVGCPKEMGCLSNCPYRDVMIYVCDNCGNETGVLYRYNGTEYCENCFCALFDQIDDDLYLIDGEKVRVEDLLEYVDVEVIDG